MPGSSVERERAWYLCCRRSERRSRDSDPPWAVGSPASWDGGRRRRRRLSHRGSSDGRAEEMRPWGRDVVETGRGDWAWLLG
jgi:hypothetical protein